MGRSRKIRDEMSAMTSSGNASGAGLPAERPTTSGSAEYLRISRMAEGFRFCTRSAKENDSMLDPTFRLILRSNPRI